MIGKLLSVKAVAPTTLRLTWDDGHAADVDLAATLRDYPSVAKLKDAAEFARVRLSADGWSIEWPSGVDFGAPQLRQWAAEQAAAPHTAH